jgi:hypothetical protein
MRGVSRDDVRQQASAWLRDTSAGRLRRLVFMQPPAGSVDFESAHGFHPLEDAQEQILWDLRARYKVVHRDLFDRSLL